MTTRPLILLVNDDGIDSPGLAALAAALDPLGDLVIVAPSVQQSGMGRSFPTFNDGRIAERTVTYGAQSWPGYAANASPAQAMQHGTLELCNRKPDLVVSGINYGENVGTGITASGTVGAALEAAEFGIPALAISVEVPVEHHYSNDDGINFTTSIYFARLFAERWLNGDRPAGVDVLKIDIPANATPDTPWKLTYLARGPYFIPLPATRTMLTEEGRPGYMINADLTNDPNSDAGALHAGFVAVTPLTLDLTVRGQDAALNAVLNEEKVTSR